MSTSTARPERDPFATAAYDAAPGHLVQQAKRLLDQAQSLVEQAVIAERAKGTSWEAIGAELGGVTKSAAQKRFGDRVADWTRNAIQQKPVDEWNVDPFDDAWTQLDERWRSADSVIHAQEDIAVLSNATAAASGANPAEQEAPPVRSSSECSAELADAVKQWLAVYVANEHAQPSRRVLPDVMRRRHAVSVLAQYVAEPAESCIAKDALRRDIGLRQLEERVRLLEAQMVGVTQWSPEAQQKAQQEAAARSNPGHGDVVAGHPGAIPPRGTPENDHQPDAVVFKDTGLAIVGQSVPPRDADGERNRR